MNHIVLLGRLVRDPDYRVGEKNVARFTLAVRRLANNAEFIDCTAFGKNADNINKYCKQGTQIAVQGSLHISKYTKKDGTQGRGAEVWVDRFYFTAKPEEVGDQYEQQTMADDFTSVGDENLPFN